jgi:hypothetical protein
MVPVPAQVRTSSQVIVPVFGTISYDSLSHGDSGNGISYLPVSRLRSEKEARTSALLQNSPDGK